MSVLVAQALQWLLEPACYLAACRQWRLPMAGNRQRIVLEDMVESNDLACVAKYVVGHGPEWRVAGGFGPWVPTALTPFDSPAIGGVHCVAD